MMSKKKETIKEELQEEIQEEAIEDTSEDVNTEQTEPESQEASEVERLKNELAEAAEKHLRLYAEYDNFRKRSAKERDGIYKDAYVDCIKNMLPVIDNVERILTIEGDESFTKGIALIVNQMRDSLEKMGVKEIECKVFDPNMHNAVMHIEDDSYGENEIIEVFQKGYTYGEKVIRYAMVKVAN